MSAAATAAGYLYASGRLRGRNSRDGAENERPQRKERSEHMRHEENHEVKVAVYAPELDAEKPARKAPKIQYRVRRWRPSENE